MTARVVVLAQDLIWSDRLARAVEAAGASAVRVATLDRLVAEFMAADSARAGATAGADAAIVDLTALAYDGIGAIEAARAAGARVLAVGQHDDRDLRRRALEAGADRVYAYRKLFEDGPATVAAWLREPAKVGS